MNSKGICGAIENRIGDLFTCSPLEGYCRIRTPYIYPDGDVIDLYCEADGQTITATDLGETTGWLWMQSVADGRSSKQERLIQDICETHGVEFRQGMLQATCPMDGNPASIFIRVTQAALQVSALWFKQNYGRREAAPDEADDIDQSPQRIALG